MADPTLQHFKPEHRIAASATFDTMAEETYFGMNLRLELRDLILSDPDLFDRMTLWFEGVRSRRLALKAEEGR